MHPENLLVKGGDLDAQKDQEDPFRVIGRVVANHEILRLIGLGGMASVYEGKHPHLGRRALKFCQVWGADAAKQRAIEEAKLGVKLDHPGICKVYEFVLGPPDGTTPVMVMELLSGRTLLDIMRENGRTPWRDAFRTMSHVCDALAY